MSIGYLGLISCRNITVKNLELKNNIQGLLMVNTTYSTISANQIYNNYYGIYLSCSSNNNISTNQIYNNNYDGIYLHYSSNNNISANQIYNNYWDGIYLRYSSNNNITANQIYNNAVGIYLYSSSNSQIIYNDVIDNTGYGIYICYSVDYSSNHNIFHHNNFIDNGRNAFDPHTNYWCDDFLKIGNYWGDYTGVDDDNDGIGDVPYYISGGNNKDNYPLIKSINKQNILPVAIFTTSSIVTEIGNPVTFDASESYDLDSNITEYYFDFGDESNTGWITDYSKSHLYTTSGVYIATLWVKDDNYAVSNASIMVIVGQPSTPDNQLPIVDAGSDETVYVGESVLFNGTATDSDGFIIYYQWDFDGDGNYDYNSTNTGFTTHIYTMKGTYIAKFRAYDNQGGFSVDTRTVIVNEKGPVQTVSPSGGIVEYNNTTIEVPEGAITENVTFTVTEISISQPSGYTIIGKVYRIEATVTAFTQPIVIILRYNETNLPENASEDNLSIYKKVGNDWIKLDSTVDKVNNTVSALVTSFSEFAILYKLPEVKIEPTGIQPVFNIYLIAAVIITILIVTVAVMVRKKKGAVEKIERPEIVPSRPQIPMISLRCPKCKITFQVESKEKPFNIKCPNCGTEGVIK